MWFYDYDLAEKDDAERVTFAWERMASLSNAQINVTPIIESTHKVDPNRPCLVCKEPVGKHPTAKYCKVCRAVLATQGYGQKKKDMLKNRADLDLDIDKQGYCEITCGWCGKKVRHPAKQVRRQRAKGKMKSFCSRSCVGNYSIAIRAGTVTD